MADVPAIIKDGQAAAHAWLGVLQETDISGPGAQGLKVPGAIEVQSVSTGSPAAKAGIDDNDVITSIDGSNGNVTSVGAFVAWMALAKPGQVVNIDWLHNGEPRQAHVTLGTQPAVASPDWGHLDSACARSWVRQILRLFRSCACSGPPRVRACASAAAGAKCSSGCRLAEGDGRVALRHHIAPPAPTAASMVAAPARTAEVCRLGGKSDQWARSSLTTSACSELYSGVHPVDRSLSPAITQVFSA